MFRPGLYPGRFFRQLATSASASPVASVPGFGPAGAATFVLLLDPGAKVTYSWATEVITSYSGLEQRISYQAQPGIRIDGSAYLLDADSRTDRAALMRSAASGATFLIGLPFEERFIDSAAGVLVSISETSTCDWAQVGQRVVLVDLEDNTGSAVIQSTTATQLSLDAIPAGVSAVGARAMPAIPVVLDPQQGFTRYPVHVDYWDLRAKAVAYGWCGLDVMGAGAEVLTFDAGLLSASDLTDDNLIIWDRPNLIDGTAAETLSSKADLVDLGGLAFEMGGSLVPDWIRPIKMRSTSMDDFQWVKAVTRHLRGAQGMFLLSSGRDDLPVVSVPTFGQVIVAADFVTWFSSLAHRRLAITTTSNVTQYLSATSVVDNGDGTNTISLSNGALGTIDKISFVEQVRLESDDVALVWDGGAFTADLVAHVVQDTTGTSEAVTTQFAGHGLDGDIAFPVGTYSMARDMYWETGQLQAGSVLQTNGFVPHFRTALIGPPTGSAVIHCNGNNASGSTAGAGYAASSGTLAGGSGTGATGTITVGDTASAFGAWPTSFHPGLGGAGGDGTFSGGAAGGGPSSLLDETDGSIDALVALRMMLAGTNISGGAGGSSGAGTGGGFGGGGGAGAGNVVVCAGLFLNASHIIVQSIGGSGGPGSAVNCGGGGGGGGGLIALFAGRLPFPQTSNIGGAGGSGGGGSGQAGSAGGAGPAPFLFLG